MSNDVRDDFPDEREFAGLGWNWPEPDAFNERGLFHVLSMIGVVLVQLRDDQRRATRRAEHIAAFFAGILVMVVARIAWGWFA